MRYLFVALLGLVLGAVVAGVVLYFNPLSVGVSAARGATDRVFHYSLPADVLEFALGEDARFLGHVPGSDSLWEETIDRSAVLGLVLRDGSSQAVALASRLIAASVETDLVLRGVLLTDHWLVTIPGEGTLFVRTDSNAWPFLKQTALPVWYLDRPWQGPAEYWPTVGPAADNGGMVVGVSGSFAGSKGRAVERYELTELDPLRELAAANAELYVNLADPLAAVQQ